MPARPYFDDLMVKRQRLLWSVATRRQLERWEPIVASFIRDLWNDIQSSGEDVWSAEIEHHFTLVAARNLFRALDLEPVTAVPIDPVVRAELIEGRDLHEHWPENLPVFNVTPRVAQPTHRTGKAFAARNPDSGPYDWLRWSLQEGPLLLPHVPAASLHDLLDAVEQEVVDGHAEFAGYVRQRAPSPWFHENGEWWPRGDASE